MPDKSDFTRPGLKVKTKADEVGAFGLNSGWKMHNKLG
jgi:hypothetical protein